MNADYQKKQSRNTGYLTAMGAWALSFGGMLGWGAFVLPGRSFLSAAGPLGAVIGLALGAAVTLLLAMNYHCLMNHFPESGGTYAYSRSNFGYDHGFLTAWFLGLAYLVVLWCNAAALPAAARLLCGNALQFGFHYTLAGAEVYLGEVLLSVLVLCAAAALCLRRSLAMRVQIGMALALLLSVIVCAGAALTGGGAASVSPFAPDRSPLSSVVVVVAMLPWTYLGFETVCHSAPEARFPLKKGFPIMAAALGAGAVVYILLTLLSARTAPESELVPTFAAAQNALGGAGTVLMGIAALCAILTCLVSFFTALSRLLRGLAEDALLPEWFGAVDEQQVPRNALRFLLIVSALLPFLGQAAANWAMESAAVGAAVAFAIVSSAAWKTARREKQGAYVLSGVAGTLLSVFFVAEFLLPQIGPIQTVSTPSYLILAVWGVLGFLVLRMLMSDDREQRLGRTTFALVVLLATTIYTSTMWMLQSSAAAAALSETLEAFQGKLTRNVLLQAGIIVLGMAITLDVYAITQRRERQAEIDKAVAEEATRAGSRFLTNMSHEIRTPMNAILGLDSIALRNPNLAAETRDQLEKIGSSATHLMALLNDILDINLLESGRMRVTDEEFSFKSFLEQLNSSYQAQCEAKGLHYECSPVGMLEDYYIGDSGKLRRLLGNVLGNAVKFTDAPGRVQLTVEQTGTEDERATLRFTVKDSGIGIAQDYLPRIFDPFSQEDLTNTSRFGGSGLGLAITQRFLALMGGSVQVESQKGMGSVFTVEVPLKRSPRSLQQANGLSEQRLRAAVVDKDPDSCEHERMVLRAIGIDADTFLDPWEAVERIRQAHQLGSPYALIITDFKLAGMNALELTKLIRGFDGGKTAIIMLTGYNWDIVAGEALENGVDSIGAKPLFPDSLAKEIQTVLMKKAGIEVEEEAPLDMTALLSGRRILIAEDIAQNAEILRDLLEMEDIVTEHALNGQKAVELFADRAPGYYDAILMDVRMPVMDGLTATRTIRAMEREDAKLIPIIAMTANAFDEDVHLSLQAGMNAHLTKPVDIDLLYETLARYFAMQKNG